MNVDDVIIDPDELGETIIQMMEEYGVETRDRVDKATTEVTKSSKDTVKANANIEHPDKNGRIRHPNRIGKYKKSITYKMEHQSLVIIGHVYAKGHEYSLTHLLENGHKVWNAPGVRTRPFKHWKYGEDKAEHMLIPTMKKYLSK